MWLYGYDPATKQMSMEWRVKGASPSVKPLMQKSISTKVVVLVFYDGQGAVHIGYLSPGETVTTARYITALFNLRQAFRHRDAGNLLVEFFSITTMLPHTGVVNVSQPFPKWVRNLTSPSVQPGFIPV